MNYVEKTRVLLLIFNHKIFQDIPFKIIILKMNVCRNFFLPSGIDSNTIYLENNEQKTTIKHNF